MALPKEVQDALSRVHMIADSESAWADIPIAAWHTLNNELTRLTEIADSVDPLVIRLGEVTTRLEAANALLHRTRTTHYDAAERIRLDADIEAHLSENGHE